MDDARLWDACLSLCDRLHVEVRHAHIAAITDDDVVIYSEGGLCRIKDHWVAFIPAEWPLAKRARALAEAVAQFNLDDMFVPPGLREYLETVPVHSSNTTDV